MSNILPILFFYILIIIFQILYIKFKDQFFSTKTNLDKRIEFNNSYYEEIHQHIYHVLKERVNLLVSGKMSYKEWLEYMDKNKIVKIKDYEYYFFVFERGDDRGNEGDVIKTIIHANADYVGLSWTDVMKDIGEKFVFLRQTTDPNLIKNFFQIGKMGITKMNYFWPDPIASIPVKKESQIITIPKGKDHNELSVGIGLDLEDLDKSNRFQYSNVIHWSYLIIISLLTFLISIIVSIFSNKRAPIFKPYMFLFLTNLYLLHFLTNSEYHGTTETEIKKIDQINNGILSVSFLVGVNTFIITSLTKTSNIELFTQSAVVFAISVILLLFSAFKVTDAITINELIEDRIGNQLIFNFSILLNAFVVLNYIVSIFRFGVPSMKNKTTIKQQ